MNGLLNYTRQDFLALFAERGLSTSHVKPFLKGLYRDGLAEPFAADFMPKAAKAIGVEFVIYQPELVALERSQDDGSLKFLLKMSDGKEVETVLIPEKNRLTLCLSSQVGCRQKCVFCFTGKMGLLRNLRTEEIVSQVMYVNRWISQNPEWLQSKKYPKDLRVTNVVFMGMGEPLDNTEALIPAIQLLKDPWGLNLAPRRITVSTAGHLDGLKKLIASKPGVSLALSLHAAKETLRNKIMPINRTNSLAEVLKVIEDYTIENAREIFIQYTLFSGVNDRDEDASALIDLLKNKPVKINLIPFNEVSFSALKRPEVSVVKHFQGLLLKGGIRTTVRFSKGRDIQAACGQLHRDKNK